jgi:hypothetical protein
MQLDARWVARLKRGAAYGAYAVAGGLLAVYAGIVALTWPVRTGGMNIDIASIVWICVFVPVLALAAVHIVFARQLLQDAADSTH